MLTGSAALVLLALSAAGAALVAPAAATAAVGLQGAAAAGGGGGGVFVPSWGLGAIMAAVAALLGAAHMALGRLVQSFVFVDYDICHVGKRPRH